MGVWGPLPTENDDAADWLVDFQEAPSLVQLENAFSAVLDVCEEEYVEITECAVAVIAAEIVAQLRGRRSETRVIAEDECAVLAAKLASLPTNHRITLMRSAHDSVLFVGTNEERSELYGVWHGESSYNAQEWDYQINNLAERLQALVIEEQALGIRENAS